MEAIQELFGVQSRVEIDHLKRLFDESGRVSCYNASDGLALADSPVLVSDLVSQVLSGLDEEYNPVVMLIQGNCSVSWTNM